MPPIDVKVIAGRFVTCYPAADLTDDEAEALTWPARPQTPRVSREGEPGGLYDYMRTKEDQC